MLISLPVPYPSSDRKRESGAQQLFGFRKLHRLMQQGLPGLLNILSLCSSICIYILSAKSTSHLPMLKPVQDPSVACNSMN